MAFLLRMKCKLPFASARAISSRHGAENYNKADENNVLRNPIRQVFISQSNDVFTNLALEDWLYQNHDFDHKSLLLLWKNDPCVVIGRHQNPWVEANVPFLRDNYTKLARRSSGGGTVYHDLGNLNCTFFTRRSDYDRRRNLDVVCQAIRNVMPNNQINVEVNARDDIVVNGLEDDDKKISGTAAKLGRKNAYHHCTVLVDVNECVLHDALHSNAEGVESRATQSVRVPVKNLSQFYPQISVDALQESLGWQFLRTNVDGDVVDDETLSRQRGFQLALPDDVWFPGLDRLRQEFESKQWIFGKTPKFKVCRSFKIPHYLTSNVIGEAKLEIELEVVKGVVDGVRISCEAGQKTFETQVLADAVQGLEFGPNLPQEFYKRIKLDNRDDLKQFFTNRFFDMVSTFT